MGKVLDFISHADAVKAVPLQTKVEVYQRITRDWAKYLTVSETIVLLAVADRTLGWGRREAYFTVKAMVEGDSIYAPLPMSRPTVFRALASLERMGFISRRHFRDAANHTHPKVHFSVNINWKPGMVNPLTRLKGAKSGSHDETGGSHHETLYTVSPTPVSHNDSQGRGIAPRPAIETENPFPGKKEGRPQPQTPSPRQRTPIASAAVLIREQVAQVEAISRAERANGQGSPSRPGTQANTAVIERAWRQAILEAFPHNAIPAWGVREKSQAKTAAAKWLHNDQIDFPSFVSWAATNWTAIMRKQFKWMTKSPPPAVPAWSFLISFIDQFAECWGEHKLEEWLNDADRTEIEKIMARGMTWEQAMSQHAKSKAVGALRGEMEKREARVRYRERAADLALDRAAKLADYVGNAPVHPRSRAAMRMRREAAEAERVPTTIAAPEPFTGVPMLPARNPFDG